MPNHGSTSGKIGKNNIFPFVGMERLHFMTGFIENSIKINRMLHVWSWATEKLRSTEYLLYPMNGAITFYGKIKKNENSGKVEELLKRGRHS